MQSLQQATSVSTVASACLHWAHLSPGAQCSVSQPAPESPPRTSLAPSPGPSSASAENKRDIIVNNNTHVAVVALMPLTTHPHTQAKLVRSLVRGH